MTQSFKVAILLATYNRAHLITSTLESIRSQTNENWECFIVDDFSSDNSEATIKDFCKDDSRFHYLRKPNHISKGLSASRNYGLQLVTDKKFDFIQFFDDDDIMHPEKLEIQVRSLQEKPEAKFSLCGSKNFYWESEINGNEVQERFQSRNLKLGESYLSGDLQFVAQAPLFRHDYALNFKFDENLFYAEEWALFTMNFLLEDPFFVIVEKVLYYRRKHPDSITEKADKNFLKKTTSLVVNIKIFDFLKNHSAHSRFTLFHFAKIFLLFEYNPKVIKEISELIKNNKACSRFDYLKFLFIQKFHWFNKNIILRLLPN